GLPSAAVTMNPGLAKDAAARALRKCAPGSQRGVTVCEPPRKRVRGNAGEALFYDRSGRCAVKNGPRANTPPVRHVGEPDAAQRRIRNLCGRVEDRLICCAYLQFVAVLSEHQNTWSAVSWQAYGDAVLAVRIFRVR